MQCLSSSYSANCVLLHRMVRYKLVHLVQNLPVEAITVQFSLHTMGEVELWDRFIYACVNDFTRPSMLCGLIVIFRRLFWSLMIIRITDGCFYGETGHFRHDFTRPSMLFGLIVIFRRLFWSLMIIRITDGCFCGETGHFRHDLKIEIWTLLLKTSITVWVDFLLRFFRRTSST